MMKVLVIERPAYRVFVEPCDFGHVVHCDVLGPWTATMKCALALDFMEFRKLYGRPLFATHYPEQGYKHRKFLRLFGFSPLTHAVDGEGRFCWMYQTPALDQSKGKPNG